MFETLLKAAKQYDKADTISLAETIWLAEHICSPNDNASAPSASQTATHQASPKQLAQPDQREAATDVLPNNSSEIVPSSEGKSPIRAASPGNTGQSSTAKSIAALPSLPDKAQFRQALRAFACHAPQRATEIDETETAEQFARQGGQCLRLVPQKSMRRWLKMCLVVETNGSNALWTQPLAELEQVLRMRGVFRQVSRKDLCAEAANYQWWKNEIILVASDFTSTDWWNGRYPQLLRKWAKTQPVVLMHTLPTRLWRRSWTGKPDAFAKAALPAQATQDLQITLDPEQFEFEQPPSRFALPLISMQAASMEQWAMAMMQDWAKRTPALVLAARQTEPFTEPSNPAPRNVEQLVLSFKGAASALTRKLAQYMAVTAPLNFPVMRLVQQAMLPESDASHLEEFFLGGLLERVSGDDTTPADQVLYDFVEGARPLLQQGLRISHGLEVLQLVGQYLEESNSDGGKWQVAVDWLGENELQELPVELRAFALVSQEFMARIGFSKKAPYLDIKEKNTKVDIKNDSGPISNKFDLNEIDGLFADDQAGEINADNAPQTENKNLSSSNHHENELRSLSTFRKSIEQMRSVSRTLDQINTFKKATEPFDALRKAREPLDILRRATEPLDTLRKAMEPLNVYNKAFDNLNNYDNRWRGISNDILKQASYGSLSRQIGFASTALSADNKLRQSFSPEILNRPSYNSIFGRSAAVSNATSAYGQTRKLRYPEILNKPSYGNLLGRVRLASAGMPAYDQVTKFLSRSVSSYSSYTGLLVGATKIFPTLNAYKETRKSFSIIDNKHTTNINVLWQPEKSSTLEDISALTDIQDPILVDSEKFPSNSSHETLNNVSLHRLEYNNTVLYNENESKLFSYSFKEEGVKLRSFGEEQQSEELYKIKTEVRRIVNSGDCTFVILWGTPAAGKTNLLNTALLALGQIGTTIINRENKDLGGSSHLKYLHDLESFKQKQLSTRTGSGNIVNISLNFKPDRFNSHINFPSVNFLFVEAAGENNPRPSRNTDLQFKYQLPPLHAAILNEPNARVAHIFVTSCREVGRNYDDLCLIETIDVIKKNRGSFFEKDSLYMVLSEWDIEEKKYADPKTWLEKNLPLMYSRYLDIQPQNKNKYYQTYITGDRRLKRRGEDMLELPHVSSIRLESAYSFVHWLYYIHTGKLLFPEIEPIQKSEN